MYFQISREGRMPLHFESTLHRVFRLDPVEVLHAE
jgi:hypothetical protein